MVEIKRLNGNITIESGIPIPETRVAKYPFDKLEIGQSFWIEKSSRQVSTHGAYWGKKLSRKFKCQSAKKDGKHGCRIWRIE